MVQGDEGAGRGRKAEGKLMGDLIPLSEVLGDRNKSVKIEESWSKDVPVSGANAPIEENWSREAAIEASLRATQRLRAQRAGMIGGANGIENAIVKEIKDTQVYFYFFVVDEVKKSLVFMGKRAIETAKLDLLKKDLTGRMMRLWIKDEFPGRRNYEKVACWEGDYTLAEMDESGLFDG